ncbi:hypothetical protein [Clostridium sp. D53t1_180928_C8]|uniref:hypothetical protein n=1 Tax=Clostridium sp. D53t1_180928_C8 TaxID=2787101 RepID=UPI0018A90111|nr:hypothetical protein [Clostridium sp. D53t1_180928_C8]
MIQTKVSNVKEKVEFKYDVNNSKDGIGQCDFTSNIEMYIVKTSIDYDPISIITSETNKKNSKVQVLGKFKIILLNTALEESKDVYIKLIGNLNNVFRINKIFKEEYTTSNYIMGTYINIGKVPAKINNINGVKEVEILMEYIGNKPGDTITLQINAYEYEEIFNILNMPSIKITATYASLQGVVTMVDMNNNEKSQPVNITAGKSVYYLTEITNEGNIGANSIYFSQVLDLNYCSISEVRYGYDKNLNNILYLSGNIVQFIIDDNILAYGGKYYVRVQVTVNL